VAYGLWGLFPLYFALLDGISPVEVVANRVVWSLVFLIILTSATRSWATTVLAARSGRTVGLLGLAAAFLALNWGVYVWAVVSDQIVEASLGYFINPLVSVALGVIVLRERLNRAQWAAVGIAILAVGVVTFSYGRPPWISIVLALSFGIYGLIKKQVGIGSVPSLTIETAVLAPVALVVMGFFIARGDSGFTDGVPLDTVLLILLGLVTALPLLAFGGAATRIPLSTLGLLQYITPVLQFLIGVVIFSEPMSTSRWAGFALVWLALVVLSVDGLRRSRGRSTALEVVEPD